MGIRAKQIAPPFVILDFFFLNVVNVSGLFRSVGGVYFQSSITFKHISDILLKLCR